MSVPNPRLDRAVVGVVVAMVLLGALPDHAGAATLYYNANGTGSGYGTSNGGTTTWEGSVWSTTSSSTAAAGAWVQGDFAEFLATSATYTVTVANDQQIAGMYNAETTSNVTVKINQAASTSGQLDIVSGVQGFLIQLAGSGIVINAPITGPGGIEQEVNGFLSLFGNNSYKGGTIVTGGQTLNYNNNNSFGDPSGHITVQGTGQGMVNAGPAGVTIPNVFDFPTANFAINLQGGNPSGSTPGTNFTGKFNLPSSGTTNIETSNVSTSVTEISGVIGGSSGLEVSDKGTLILAGANTYTGPTTVTAAVGGPATLVLGAANTIASSSGVIMDGGILNPGGFVHTMSATTLGMTSSSTIDFIAGASEMDFANSAALSWTGTLNLANWDPSLDKLRFGTDATGLTSAQLAEIEQNGDSTTLGLAYLDPNGYVVVPEPATTFLLLGAPLLLLSRRRKI